MKKIVLAAACCLAILTGCGNMSNLGKGALIGTGAGVAAGAGIGALIGGEKGAAIGAAIGTAVGAGAGAVIGDVMDRKAAELAAIQDASVETVEDVNGLQAIKVTFDSGILFDTNKSNLSSEAKANLKTFSEKMQDMPDTQITIFGHTDNTGTAEVNQKLSQKRADAVATQLQNLGIDKGRIVSEGKSFDFPVADNATAEGRAQNRRVELFISADENMVKAAENGTLK